MGGNVATPGATAIARALSVPSLARVAAPALVATLAALADELHLDAADAAQALGECARHAAVAAAGGRPWAVPRLLHALPAYLEAAARRARGPGLARAAPTMQYRDASRDPLPVPVAPAAVAAGARGVLAALGIWAA